MAFNRRDHCPMVSSLERRSNNERNVRKRILIVDLSKRHGGVDVRVVDVAAGLREQCEVLVAVLKDSPVAKLLQQAGVATFPIQRRRHDPHIILDILRIINEFSPDVIDTHNVQSQLWGGVAAKLSGVRMAIATVHTTYGIAHRGFLRQRLHEAVLLFCRMLNFRFIVVSKSIQNYLINLGVSPSRITLSYNGVPALPGDVQQVGIREALKIPETQLLVGFIGRIEKVKGYDVLIPAIAKLREKGCLIQVVIIGAGTEEDELRRLISVANLGSQVHLLGHRKDIVSIMIEIDALCMPSRSEGLPYTALEAARSGLPIVASGVDGLREIFVDHVTALLVPPENVDALAKALEELVFDADLRSRLGKAAQDDVSARFTIPRMVTETLAAYSLGR